MLTTTALDSDNMGLHKTHGENVCFYCDADIGSQIDLVLSLQLAEEHQVRTSSGLVAIPSSHLVFEAQVLALRYRIVGIRGVGEVSLL